MSRSPAKGENPERDTETRYRPSGRRLATSVPSDPVSKDCLT